METGDTSDTYYPIPLSGFPSIEWPAITVGKHATLLALLYQLRDTEWWPEHVIKASQHRQLKNLIKHARETVPYYAGRLDDAVGADILDDEILQRLPILNRKTLQKYEDALVSSAIPKEHGKITDQISSGSTGRPVNVKITELNELFFAALNLRQYQWHKLDFRETIGAVRLIKKNEIEHARLNKPIAWVAGHASGAMHLFDVTLPVSRQVTWLRKQKSTYLLTLPSNLAAILDYIENEEISLPCIRKVLTLSEITPPELRRRCRDVLDAPLIDCYSAYETGMIALQCPQHDHYHVQSESLLVEVVDDNDAPCTVGEVGRVLITDLHNFAMPLIRYEVGDYAEVGAPCPCGRGLPVLNRILGRKRNMVTYPSGDKSWPVAWLSSEIVSIAPINQIQLIQHSCDEIEAKLATARPLTREEETVLIVLFQKRLRHSFAFRFTYVDEIPRSAGGKFEDFMSMIK